MSGPSNEDASEPSAAAPPQTEQGIKSKEAEANMSEEKPEAQKGTATKDLDDSETDKEPAKPKKKSRRQQWKEAKEAKAAKAKEEAGENGEEAAKKEGIFKNFFV